MLLLRMSLENNQKLHFSTAIKILEKSAEISVN